MEQNIRTGLLYYYSVFFLILFFSGSATADTVAAAYNLFFSSPNPVGSGARALGMGGAFIGVSDDATAASWNPGGLVQLKKPEVSVVGGFIFRNDNYDMVVNQKAYDSKKISGGQINYASAVYPFSLFRRNMVVSFNYQRLYDYRLKQKGAYSQVIEADSTVAYFDIKVKRERTGTLAPFGVAYSLQVIPQLSFGITLNFWEPQNGINKVVDKYTRTSTTNNDPPISSILKMTDEIEGFNANMGLLWKPSHRFSIGIVYKSCVYADVRRTKYQPSAILEDPSTQLDEKLKMPASYGIGFCHKLNDNFKLSADIYMTDWDDYTYTNSDHIRFSPITGNIKSESEVEATVQVRTGLEYLLVNPAKQYTIPLRCGLFLDPIPSQGAPDNVYGGSLGIGIATGKVAIDTFYQYKFAPDINTIDGRPDLIPREIDEHIMFFSIIYYL